MTDISQLGMIKFVSDADTPANFAQYNGLIVGLPADAPSQLPVTEHGVALYGVYGFARLGAEGWEWVMRERVSRALRLALNQIPPGGWNVTESRQVYRQAGRVLLDTKMAEANIPTFLANLYHAAVAEGATH